ncbi:MAG: hypothetical protein WC569_01820, partial [Candidatus Omnitrophota bacterium]
MKLKIVIIFMCVFGFIQSSMAMEPSDKITRISIATSDAVKYESRWLDNPPRLIIKFKTQDVFGQLIDRAEFDQGIIKNISISYYPAAEPREQKRVKFLTFWLNQKTPYKIWNFNDRIFIDFKAQDLKSGPRQVEISSVVKVSDAGSKDKAIAALLASFEKTSPRSAGPIDIKWILASLLIGVYIMWFRPAEWRRFMDSLRNHEIRAYPGREKRKWWRHNLLPLKEKNLYIKIESPETNTHLGLIPRDIGYGGLCFECNSLKKLKGRLNLR